jgi:hypothetical protein
MVTTAAAGAVFSEEFAEEGEAPAARARGSGPRRGVPTSLAAHQAAQSAGHEPRRGHQQLRRENRRSARARRPRGSRRLAAGRLVAAAASSIGLPPIAWEPYFSSRRAPDAARVAVSPALKLGLVVSAVVRAQVRVPH